MKLLQWGSTRQKEIRSLQVIVSLQNQFPLQIIMYFLQVCQNDNQSAIFSTPSNSKCWSQVKVIGLAVFFVGTSTRHLSPHGLFRPPSHFITNITKYEINKLPKEQQYPSSIFTQPVWSLPMLKLYSLEMMKTSDCFKQMYCHFLLANYSDLAHG